MCKKKNIYKSASLLKSVGHPIRIQIIRLLDDYKELTVTELSNYLSIDQPIMSLHLGVLRKHAVIMVRKKGKQSLYSISDTSVKQVVNIIYNTRNF